MSPWRSVFLTGFVVIAGAVSPGAMAGEKIEFSIAGINSDKIQFSAPAAPIDVPVTLKEEQNQPPPEYRTSATADRLFFEDNVQASSATPSVVIITPSRAREDKRSDSTSAGYSDEGRNNPDPYTSYNSYDVYGKLRAKQTEIPGMSNSWSVPKEWSLETGIGRQTDGNSGQDNFRTRLNAIGSQGSTDNQRNGRDGWRSQNATSLDDPGSTPSYLHHDAPSYGRTYDGSQFWPTYSEMMLSSKQPNSPSASATPTVADDVTRSATSVPGMTDYRASRDTGTPGLSTAPQQLYRLPETRQGNTRNADTYARQDPYGAPPIQNEAPPAILPFPKRPGDVLK